MEDKKKSFERFVKEEMKKPPEQIEKEILSDPAYPKLTPTPIMHDKLMARIMAFEAERAEKEEAQEREWEKSFAQLSEDDKVALRLGRELMARQKDEKEMEGDAKIVHMEKTADDKISTLTEGHPKKRKRKKKAYVLVAAAAICVCGLGITAMGGPDTVIKTMTGTLGGREQSRVDARDSNNMISSGELEEETAYQTIKDELGFDAVRPVYLPDGYYFKSIETSEETHTTSIVYTNGTQNLFYLVQAYYMNNKSSFDIEDVQVKEYDLQVEGNNIIISEYAIEGVEQKEYTAEFVWRNIGYRLIGSLPKEMFEEVVKNLHFA